MGKVIHTSNVVIGIVVAILSLIAFLVTSTITITKEQTNDDKRIENNSYRIMVLEKRIDVLESLSSHTNNSIAGIETDIKWIKKVLTQMVNDQYKTSNKGRNNL